MKISTRRDVDLSVDKVFAALVDFPTFAEQARDRGAEVTRLDDGTEGPARARWRVRFAYRGRPRQVDARVVTFDPDTQLAIKVESDSIDALFNVELMEVAPDLTRMFVSIDMRPRSMTGRLIIQSLKLSKTALTRRFDKRLAGFAHRIEAQHRPDRA